MSDRVRWENHIKVSTLDSVVRIAKALPSIRRNSKAARRLSPLLEYLPVDLELPSREPIMDHVEQTCRTPHRRPGTPEGRQEQQDDRN